MSRLVFVFFRGWLKTKTLVKGSPNFSIRSQNNLIKVGPGILNQLVDKDSSCPIPSKVWMDIDSADPANALALIQNPSYSYHSAIADDSQN